MMETLTPKFEQLKKPLQEAIQQTFQEDSFPIEIFPEDIQKIFKETEKLSFCKDFLAGGLLSVVSTAIGNSCRILVKKGWTENAIIYGCIVGNSGTNKTAPLKFAQLPLLKKDVSAYKQYEEELQVYKANARLPKEQQEDIPFPILKKFIVNDATIEAIHIKHKHNERGLLMFNDELAGFFNNQNRYNKGSEQQQWLQNFSGMPISIDRKKEEALMIERPHISIICGIQPKVINKIFADKTDDGTIDRFLFFMPEVMPEIKWTEEEINPEVFEIWETIVQRILELDMENPTTFHFSPEARKFLFEWQNSLEKTTNDFLLSIDAKLQTYVIRFCLILQVLREIEKQLKGEKMHNEVELDTVKDAIKLYHYFRKNAIKVRSEMGLLNHIDTLPENKKELLLLLPDEFSYADAKTIMETSELMRESTLKTFLKDVKIFKRVKQGQYQKIYNGKEL